MQITDENFKDYFFPAREDYKPQKGQVLARWRATADFVDGWIKRNIIQMLCENKNGADHSYRVMKKLIQATDKDALAVLIAITEDLLAGLSLDEITEKPYRFTIEQFYWTNKEYVPVDPHWTVISCVDLRGIHVESEILNGLPEPATV